MSESSTVYQFVDTNGDWPYNIHVEGCRGAKETRYSAKHHNLTPNEVAQNSYHVLFDNSSLPRFEGNTFADLETSLVRIHNCLTADMKREIKSATFTRMSPKEEEELYDYQGNAESFAADGPFVCSECSAFGVNDLRPEDEMCSACLKLGQFYCFDCCAENHAESFEAESFEDFKRIMIGDGWIAGDMGYMEGLEEYYNEYLEDFTGDNPESFEDFQERILREDYTDEDFKRIIFGAETFAAWKRHPTTGAIRYGTRELFDLQSDLAKMGLPTSGNVRKLKERKRRYSDWDAESFNAPYAGAGALMPIKGDTALSSFSGKELAQSSAIHGDFNQASINYSGHQNLEVRGAEENRFPYPEAQVTNIVRVKDKVYVTIRYPDTDEYYGYEKILVGDMEDVMLAESFGADGQYLRKSKYDDNGRWNIYWEGDSRYRNYAISLKDNPNDIRIVVEYSDGEYSLAIPQPDIIKNFSTMDEVLEYLDNMGDGAGGKPSIGVFAQWFLRNRSYPTVGDWSAETFGAEDFNRKAVSLINYPDSGERVNYQLSCGHNITVENDWFSGDAKEGLGEEWECFECMDSFGAEYGKRQRFGNRYVARNTKGEFISNVGVGASLKADRRNKSKTPARSGFGNRGDSQKGVVVDSSGKSLVGLGLLVGGVWALLDSRGTQSIK